MSDYDVPVTTTPHASPDSEQSLISSMLGLSVPREEPEENVVKLGLYARISEANDELGVSRQVREMKEFLPRHPWLRGKKVVIVDEYIDNDISAYDIRMVRPDFLRMVGDVTTGRLNAVMAWDPDRLARQPLDGETLIRQLEIADGQYLLTTSAGDNVDIQTGEGSEIYRIKGAMAHGEAKKTSRRQRTKHKELFENGQFSGGKRRYGYNKDMSEVIAEEKEVILEVATRVLAGESLTSLAKELNERGVKTALYGHKTKKVDFSKSKWSASNLRRCISGVHLIGYRVRGGEAYKARWEPIMPMPMWMRIKTLFSDPTRTTYTGGGKPSSPLTGLLRCGVVKEDGTKCLAKLRMQQVMRKAKKRDENGEHYKDENGDPIRYAYHYWACNSPEGCHGIQRSHRILYPWIIDEILDTYQDEAFINRLILAGQEVENRDNLLAELRGSEELLREINDAYYMPKPGTPRMPKADWERYAGTHQRRIDDLRRQLRMMTSKYQIDADLVFGGGLNEKWSQLPMSQQASLIKFAVDYIEVKQTGRKDTTLLPSDHYIIHWLDKPNAIPVKS